MPQRGFVLQPRVAASATLGKWKKKDFQPQRGCVILIRNAADRRKTALRLIHKMGRGPRIAQSGNPGLEDAGC